MAPFSSLSGFLHAAIALLSLSRLSLAQLSSCDAVNCPLDQYRNFECVVGNASAIALGITSFTSPLSSQPLTWTIVVQGVNGPSNNYERDFFLGTSPSLNLTAGGSSQSQACGLFFEGVATKIKFPGTDREYDQGTCDDALTQSCVNDLRTQARTELANIRGGSGGYNDSLPASVCGKLGDVLRDDAPKTCTVVSDGRWGDVLVRPLTGVAAAPLVDQGDCHPTTGKDYNLALVASNRLSAPSRNITDITPILFGVTPIMTIVYGGGVPDSDVDLSCLKTVGPKTNTTTNTKSAATGRHGGSSTTLILGISYLSVYLLPEWFGI